MNNTREKKGKIYLVGAGPGDPGLITVKAVECLNIADVVIYDFLANPILLAHASPEAEVIYVGKSASDHTLSQQGINELIVHKALEGNVVVRLKGGDPRWVKAGPVVSAGVVMLLGVSIAVIALASGGLLGTGW